MFGSCCSGRPVQLADQVDSSKYAITIANGTKVSHVALFLLPNVQLDPSFTALIYFQLPNQEFRLFGSISASKPSAIFKLNNNTQQAQSQILDDTEMDMDTDESEYVESSDPLDNITVGISIESNEEAEGQLALAKQSQLKVPPQRQLTATPHSDTSNPNHTALLAGKIVKNAYNYLTSFVDDEGRVSIKYFDSWWDKFRTKLINDPKFLESNSQQD